MPHRIDRDRVLLSTAEACAQSGLSQDYIQWLLRRGRLEGFKAGHDWLVFEDSLTTFVAQPRKPGPKPRGGSLSGSPHASSMAQESGN
jgi:excisionase family DNA binding protein